MQVSLIFLLKPLRVPRTLVGIFLVFFFLQRRRVQRRRGGPQNATARCRDRWGGRGRSALPRRKPPTANRVALQSTPSGPGTASRRGRGQATAPSRGPRVRAARKCERPGKEADRPPSRCAEPTPTSEPPRTNKSVGGASFFRERLPRLRPSLVRREPLCSVPNFEKRSLGFQVLR